MAPVQYVLLSAVPTAERQAELHEKAREQIVDELLLDLQEQVRCKKHADVYKETHDQLLTFLRPFFASEQEAHDALADAYVGLLAGKCKKEHLFRAAKQRAIDRQRRLAVEAQLFERLDTLHVGRDEESGASEEHAASIFEFDLPSPHADDQDPLEILARKEELEDGIRKAITDRKHRGIRGCQWLKDLLEFTESGKAVMETAG